MGIGGSIFLIALGAIIAFGVNNQSFGPFDLDVVGWVLMAAGFVGMILTMYVWTSRRRRVVTTGMPPTVERHVVQQPPAAGGIIEEETYQGPPADRRY
jgi:hypothetical protein